MTKMRELTIVYLIGIGFPRESCQNEQCSRKPSLNDYQHLLNVSQNQLGIQTLDSKDRAVRSPDRNFHTCVNTIEIA